MIKIKANKVEDVTEYDVEPKAVTLYCVDKYDKDVIKVENCVFKNAIPISANDYWLEYENDEDYIYVKVDIKTGAVKEESGYFFDYEQAVKIHRERRIKVLRNRIVDLKDVIEDIKECEKELEELENFDKKGGKV